jgi:hypothetical protein
LLRLVLQGWLRQRRMLPEGWLLPEIIPAATIRNTPSGQSLQVGRWAFLGTKRLANSGQSSEIDH